MSQTLTLELPEAADSELVRSAGTLGELPERVASQILAKRFTDPVLKLAGSISSELPNVADRHDELIGASLSAE